jgi:hypothetical protein
LSRRDVAKADEINDGVRSGAAGKDKVNSVSPRASTRLHVEAAPNTLPHLVAAPRGPEPLGLTLDEIRRIVLDLIG